MNTTIADLVRPYLDRPLTASLDVTFDDAVRYRQAIEAARPLTSDFRILGEYAECPNPVI